MFIPCGILIIFSFMSKVHIVPPIAIYRALSVFLVHIYIFPPLASTLSSITAWYRQYKVVY